MDSRTRPWRVGKEAEREEVFRGLRHRRFLPFLLLLCLGVVLFPRFLSLLLVFFFNLSFYIVVLVVIGIVVAVIIIIVVVIII